MIVCKGGRAFREALCRALTAYKPPVANSHILSDTPGYSSSNLSQFTYTKIARPIVPLDDK